MRRAYLFIYADELGSRDDIKQFLNARPEMLYWRYDLPNTFYLISDQTAQVLADVIQTFNTRGASYLVCEAGANKQGLLVPDTWHLLNSGYPVQR